MAEERLLLDVMLGKLTTYLRMCGYDAAYAGEEGLETDEAIRARAHSEDRTLLTRDRELAAGTDDALLLESTAIEEQLAECAGAGLELSLPEEPDRCSVCNGRVVAAEERPEHAPDDVGTVWRCTACDQYFWKGSHWERVRETLRQAGEA
jgi:uncharacterized protein with PIN domain